jgi:hypothetical protein
MKTVRLICALLALLAGPYAARAAELVMVEQRGCEWCEAWDAEVGTVYHKTPEGRAAPLRRVNIHDALPHDLAFIRGLVYTPTFVLVEESREIGRIVGYPGEDFFWGLLQELVGKLPASRNVKMKAGGKPEASPATSGRSEMRG